MNHPIRFWYSRHEKSLLQNQNYGSEVLFRVFRSFRAFVVQ